MLLEKTTKPFCLPYAFAMVLGIKPKELLEEVGRPLFHIQDMIDCCLRRGYAVTEIQAVPQMCDKIIKLHLEHWERIWHIIHDRKCVLYDDTHAVAWSGSMVYDPKGKIYGVVDFKIKGIYLISKIKDNFMI